MCPFIWVQRQWFVTDDDALPLCGVFVPWPESSQLQYIPINMHTVFALLCFFVVIHWLIFPYPSGLLHWHRGNLTIAPVPAKQPWWIWINIWCEFIMNDCVTTTKQSTTKPCAYCLGYIVQTCWMMNWTGDHRPHLGPIYMLIYSSWSWENVYI